MGRPVQILDLIALFLHVLTHESVRGPVNAKELLELQPKARIEGDVCYKALEMHQGAIISGLLRPLVGGVGAVNGKPTGIQMPSSVELAVTETEPGLRGDTACLTFTALSSGTTVETVFPTRSTSPSLSVQ